MQTLNAETLSNNDALKFKAHEAYDTFKKILKDCYISTTDEDDECNYQEALEALRDYVHGNLPELPKAKLSVDERRRQKENEF